MINSIKFKKIIILSIIALTILLVLPTTTNAQLLDDSKCASQGGDCLINTGSSACSNGSFVTGLCSGATNRQCCISSNQSKSGFTPIGSDSSSRSITIPNPLGVRTFADLIAKINRWLIWVGGPILTLMILIGAFQIMMAGGNPEKIITGKHTITYAIVGYALLLLSTGIIFIIRDVLGAR